MDADSVEKEQKQERGKVSKLLSDSMVIHKEGGQEWNRKTMSEKVLQIYEIVKENLKSI